MGLLQKRILEWRGMLSEYCEKYKLDWHKGEMEMHKHLTDTVEEMRKDFEKTVVFLPRGTVEDQRKMLLAERTLKHQWFVKWLGAEPLLTVEKVEEK